MHAAGNVNCDEKTICEFLESISDRDTFHLCKFDSRKDHSAPICFNTQSIEEALDWIVKNNSDRWNIYEQFNPPSPKHKKKAKRIHIKWIVGAHLDWDMPPNIADEEADDWLEDAFEAINNLPGVPAKPHIVMTGNGLQARWPLINWARASHEAIIAIEDINLRITTYLKGDDCFNVDRLLRVAGTVNWPTPKKKERDGRVPVISEIWQVSRTDYHMKDFGGLPKVSKKTSTVIGKNHRVDYREWTYADDYEPLTWEELLDQEPLILQQAMELEHNTDHDRSRMAYGFLHTALRAICHAFDQSADELIDDTDVYKNLMELAGESDLPFLDKYDQEGFALMGRDIHKVVLTAADGETNTPRTRRRAEYVRERERRLSEPGCPLTAQEHRKHFIEHVRRCMDKDRLPNCRETRDGAAALQNATEANIREIFQEAGIIARWDVMRDKPVYDVKERAGKPMRGDSKEKAEERATAPRKDFHGALARNNPDMLSVAQESLLADAVFSLGIMTRNDLGKLFEIIAKENRFHPLEDYCKASPWDGTPRIHRLASCLETDHPLRDTYMRVFFRQCIGAVVSLDRYKANGKGEMLRSVVVLVGEQEIGKTSFWDEIVPDGFMSKGSKLKFGNRESDTMRACLSGLVTNLDEIGAGLNFSEAEDVKNFIAQRVDEYRVAFAHNPTIKPRMTVFVGTSNDMHLRDHTGSSRFLVMDVRRIDWDKMNELLGNETFLQQCYAEAWHEVIECGKTWWLDGEEAKTRDELNARWQEMEEEDAALSAYLENVTSQHKEECVAVSQIMQLLGIKYTPIRVRRMRLYLEKYGFEEVHRKRGFYRFPITVDAYLRVARGM